MPIKHFDYWKIDKYIPENICDHILDTYSQYEEGTIILADDVVNKDEKTRDSDVCWIDEPFWKNTILDVICRVNIDSGLNFNIKTIEPLQLTRYVAPHGHYDFHQDGNGYTTKNNLTRKLSFSCLLNNSEDFEGGELEFFTSTTPHSVKLNKGDIVVFPSYQLHRVKPVTKGKRYSLVAWVDGPQFQ